MKRLVTSSLRVLPMAALLCLLAVEASANHLHYIPITDTTVRRQVADKCTDALVGALATCGETLDEVVSPDGTAGCLIATHDAGVDTLLKAQYGN